MTKFRIGYRHANGEVEGFIGVALGDQGSPGHIIKEREAARHDAIKQVQAKCLECRLPFWEASLIFTGGQCSANEFKQLQADWRLLDSRGVV